MLKIFLSISLFVLSFSSLTAKASLADRVAAFLNKDEQRSTSSDKSKDKSKDKEKVLVEKTVYWLDADKANKKESNSASHVYYDQDAKTSNDDFREQKNNLSEVVDKKLKNFDKIVAEGVNKVDAKVSEANSLLNEVIDSVAQTSLAAIEAERRIVGTINDAVSQVEERANHAHKVLGARVGDITSTVDDLSNQVQVWVGSLVKLEQKFHRQFDLVKCSYKKSSIPSRYFIVSLEIEKLELSLADYVQRVVEKEAESKHASFRKDLTEALDNNVALSPEFASYQKIVDLLKNKKAEIQLRVDYREYLAKKLEYIKASIEFINLQIDFESNKSEEMAAFIAKKKSEVDNLALLVSGLKKKEFKSIKSLNQLKALFVRKK